MNGLTREERVARLRGMGAAGLQAVAAVDPDERARAERVARLRGLSTPESEALLRGSTPAQQERLTGEAFGPARPLSERSPVLQQWLADRDNAAVSRDDAAALARIDDAIGRFRPERGWIGDIAAAGQAGTLGLEASYYHLAAVKGLIPYSVAAQGVAAANRQRRGLQDTEGASLRAYRERLARASGLGKIPAFFSDVVGAASLSVENLAFSLPGIVAAGAGAVAGTAVAGPVGATVGLLGGRVAGGIATEMGAWIDQRLGELGYDVADPDDLMRAYGDPALMAQLDAEAARKGVVTVGIDALGMLVGVPKLGVGRLAEAGRRAADVVLESVVEGASEAAGQFAAVGEVDMDEAIMEGLSSLATSGAGRVVSSGVREGRRRAREAMAAAQAARDREAVDAAADAWGESKTAKRAPERLREFADGVTDRGVAGGMAESEIVAAHFDRDDWDRIWTARGKDPAEEAARILPVTGREEYLASEGTGTFSVPLGTFLDSYQGSQEYGELANAARWRPGAPKAVEQEVALSGGELLASLEDEMARAGTLYQREQDLAEQIAAIDEQLEAMARGEATEATGGEPGVPRGTAEESPAAAGPVETGGAGEQPAAPSEDSLLANRVALKAELDDLVQKRTAREKQAGQIQARVAADLIAAGRPADEARHGAAIYAAGLGAFSSRWGIPVEDLARRFPLAVTRASQKRSAQGASAVPPPGGGELAQTAYHGGRRFDPAEGFKLTEIGTGEGNAVYGWGLYFAEEKAVSVTYRDMVARKLSIPYAVDGDRNTAIDFTMDALRLVDEFGEKVALRAAEGAVRRAQDELAVAKKNKAYARAEAIEQRMSYDEETLRDVKRLQGRSVVKDTSGAAALYTVDLAPGPDDWLQWDKPLSQQSERVQAALRGLDATLPGTDLGSFAGSPVQAATPLGGDIYRSLVLDHKDRGMSEGEAAAAASRALAAAGIPGIKYADQMTRMGKAGTYNYVVFDPGIIRILEVEQAKRARLRHIPGAPGTRAFSLEFYKKADASTFIHEMGHVFLFMLDDLVSDPSVATPAQAAADIAAIREYVGAPEGQAFTEEQHELFARSFEGFLRTGKAPSKALHRAFSAFRRWLTRIYVALSSIVAGKDDRPVELNPDIVAVFDRMLATDEQIEDATYELGTPTLPAESLAEMSDEERAAYFQQAQDAIDESVARADRDAERMVAERVRSLRSAAMERMRRKVQRELDESDIGQALAALSQEGQGIDRASLAEQVGSSSPEFADLVGLGVVQEDGVLLDEAAGAFGLDSGAALVEGLVAMADAEAIVEREAVRRLKEEQPELMGARGVRSLRRRAVANEERSKLLLRNLRILRRRAEKAESAALQGRAETGAAVVRAERAERQAARAPGEALRAEARRRRTAFDERVPTLEEVRAMAQDRLRRMTIRQIRGYRENGRQVGGPSRWLAAARRDSRRVAQRARVGDWQGAADAQAWEILNHELHREATRLLRRADRDRAFARKVSGPTAQKRLTRAGPTYRDQANGLLARFNLKMMSRRVAEDRATLAEWAAERAAEGRRLMIPKSLLDESRRQDWQSLTPDAFHELRETLEGIYHLATTKDELLAAQRERSRTRAAEAMSAQIRSSRPERVTTPGARSGLERAVDLAREFGAEGVKASYWARIMDSDRDGGPVTTHLIRPINEATTRKGILQRETLKELVALYSEHFDSKTLRALNKREVFAGASLSHEDRLAILGLWGTETGRQRLRQKFTPAQLEAIFTATTMADVAFVQARWALFDRLFVLAKAQHERISGQNSKPVEHVPFALVIDGQRVDMEGGYHPLSYNDVRLFSKDGEAWARDARSGRAPAQMFELGFLEERVEEFTGDVRLDRGVVLGHLLDITHALAMREAVIDAQALLGTPQVHNAIQKHYGREAVLSLREWLSRVAAGSGAPRGGLEKVVGYLRRKSVSATLAFRVLSAIKQLYGLRITAVRVGWGPMLRSAARWSRDPSMMWNTESWIDQKSPYMRERVTGTWQRELNEKMHSLPRRLQTPDGYFQFYFISRVQRVVDQISWMAQYEKTMSEMPAGVDLDTWEAEAIARADQAVKDSQSGGEDVDLSAWEAGGPIRRLLTMFFTDASLKFNATRYVKSRTQKDPASIARLIADAVVIYFTEAVVAGLAVSALGDDDDDDEPGILRRTLASLTETVPILRELSGPILGYQYQGSAGLSVFPAAARAIQQIGQGEMDPALWRSLNTLGGALFGYPAKAINDVGYAIDQVFEGKAPTALVGIRDRR